MAWALRILAVLVVIAAGLAYWLVFGFSKAPQDAPDVFDLAKWRTLADAPADQRPAAIHIVEVGRDAAPSFAAIAGRFDGSLPMSYNAVILDTPTGHIVIGGAVDRETATSMMTDADAWVFDDTAYSALTMTLLEAEDVLMTHEHLDHVMGIARHPTPEILAPKLRLNASQIEALGRFTIGDVPEPLAVLQPDLDGGIQLLAPGVVVAPAAGHTPGSLVVFISLADGTEALLIGDIVWNMGSIEALTTRPVLTQYVVFNPYFENREAVKNQIRALHDMMEANPELVVIPSHDRDYLLGLAKDGLIQFQEAADNVDVHSGSQPGANMAEQSEM